MAIVVIAGKTANLGWELARIETLGALPKLSIVIPAESKAEAADRLVTLVKTLDRTRVGELIRDHLHTDAIVVGFGKRTILELASTSRQLSDYAVALDIGMQFFLASRLHES